jgi:hypothetical protein
MSYVTGLVPPPLYRGPRLGGAVPIPKGEAYKNGLLCTLLGLLPASSADALAST